MTVAREIGGEEVDQEVEVCPFVQIAVTKTRMVDGGVEDGAVATLETETETVTLKAKAPMETPTEPLFLTQAGKGTGTADLIHLQEIAAKEIAGIRVGVPFLLQDPGVTADLGLHIEGGRGRINGGNVLQEVALTPDH